MPQIHPRYISSFCPLRDPKYDIADIEKRQEAIKELTSKREFSMDFETLGVKTGMGKKKKYTADEFVAYCNGDDHIPAVFNILSIFTAGDNTGGIYTWNNG